MRSAIVRESCLDAGGGGALGLVLALLFNRGLGAFLFDVSYGDWRIYAAVGVWILLIAWLSALPAARHAASVGPLLAARHE